MRQSRSYTALHETQHQVDEAPAAAPRQPRNYDSLRETQDQVDREAPKRPIQRSWTHHGDMVAHNGSANIWDKQNQEIIRMSDNRGSGAGRDGAQPSQPDRGQNDPELQEARAAVEEARRREAAERTRLQERDRGPER